MSLTREGKKGSKQDQWIGFDFQRLLIFLLDFHGLWGAQGIFGFQQGFGAFCNEMELDSYIF